MVPGAHPQPPPSEVGLPPLPGWGKCASGRLAAEAVTQHLVPAGPRQVVEDTFNGVLEQPGNPAFCNAGRDWRDLPGNMEPARERKRACKPELKYRGGDCLETVALTLTSEGQKLPRRSQDKENRQAQSSHLSPETYFDNQNSSMKCTGCERNGCYMLHAECM